MKIVCDKREFADLIRRCDAYQCEYPCDECVLHKFCGNGEIVDVIAVDTQENTEAGKG